MKPALAETRSMTALFFRWQERQSRSWALFNAAGSTPDPEVTRFLWQERQSGEGFAPLASAFPCSEARKWVLISSWQLPQASA